MTVFVKISELVCLNVLAFLKTDESQVASDEKKMRSTHHTKSCNTSHVQAISAPLVESLSKSVAHSFK